MNLLDRIKLFIKNKKNNVKALPEQTSMGQDDYRDWKASQKVQVSSSLHESKPDKVKQNIEQYIKEYYKQWYAGRVNSYSVLIGLNANQEPAGNNRAMQQQLIDYLDNSSQYRTHKQYRGNSDILSFLHIYHGKTEDDRIRLYINTQRQNVAMLAYQLIRKLGDTPYYFKFLADEAMDSKARTEKLVFYTDDMQLNTIIHALKDVKREYPQLLEGSENANPFMKKIEGFIGYAPQPKTDEYKTLNGEIKKEAPSYNSFLATALEESMTKAMQDIVAKDEILTRQTGGVIGDINQYMWVYPAISEKYKYELLSKTKQNLVMLSKNNDCIDIEGLGDEQNVR